MNSQAGDVVHQRYRNSEHNSITLTSEGLPVTETV